MNLGRGFWIPSTPDKPVAQFDAPQIPIAEENWPQIGEENWQELLGIYNEVLQNDTCAVLHPQKLDLNSHVPDDDEIQRVVPVEAYNTLQQHSNPTMVFGLDISGQNGQNVAFNNTRGCGVEEDFGEFFGTPYKVNSLAELMGMPRARNTGSSNDMSSVGAEFQSHVLHSNRSNDVSSVGSKFQSHVLHSNRSNDVSSVGSKFQSHVLHSNRDVGGCNLQEMTNSRLSVHNYNLNLPPIPEVCESSSVAIPFPFGPVTPGPQKQAQIAQVPHFFCDETSTQEKCTQNNEILISTVNESASAAVTSLNNFCGENGVIDLNQTPQQKLPSRKKKKHRPKVIREGGKPKRTPKPAPVETPKVKRKYVRKSGLETPSEANAVNVVEASNIGPVMKKSRRKRKLNFDFDNGAKKEDPTENNNDGRNNNDGDVGLPFNLNFDVSSAERSTELIGHATSVGNGSSPKKHQSHMTIDPHESLPLANMVPLPPPTPRDHRLNPLPPPTPRDHRLNIIARVLNKRNANSANQIAHDNMYYNNQVNHAHVGIPNLYTERQSNISQNNLMGSQLWSNEVSKADHCSRNNITLWKNGLITGEQRNGDRNETSSCALSGVSVQNGSRSMNFSNGVSANSDIRGQIISISPDDCPPGFEAKCEQQRTSSRLHLDSEQVATRTSQALTIVTNRNRGSASQKDPKCTPIMDIINFGEHGAVKRRSAGQTSSNTLSIVDKEVKSRRNYRNTPKKVTGSREEEKIASIDFITDLLKELQIYEKKQSALVPYKSNGAVVPYEEFDPVKKRKARPRVDLDPETNRLWNLLMGSKEGGSAETMDSNKQKWWEEERKVFRGRVDSFIARMHLVQGDRRFSKWKGSVVDSVIGVFLTQNVSDHLSSSAFMSLAARFPLKPTTICNPSEHHEVRITYPDGTSYDHKILREPSSNRSSVTSTESSSSEYKAAKHAIVEKRSEEDIISSQSSSESTVFQAYENFRSSSGSNSEADDGWNFSKNFGCLNELNSHSFKDLLFGQSQGVAASNNAYSSSYPFTSNYEPNLSLGLEKWEADVLASSEKESYISTLTSIGPTRPVTTHEPTQASQVKSSADKQASSIIGTTATPNAKKRKSEKEKVEPFDWDILRKGVQSKEGGTRSERSRDTMDSLDYEALRNADVREISDAIKERGMNNMLAERMKSFLNRIVEDHERIDLEWLRDVDPDKVKDYLLSIRGLGLKSVECVRLLTLHHLAFPVDTNVGRIAVRLGWVPLQPLPESLQLHLLELYPVLETIQKYLWPRLCKMDQETLYELHYQMITFGKVFCTKREPNCNGCPMRGECRHFASAFASARLALPGPEEKRIVTSSAPPVTPIKRPPDVIIKPMLLLDPSEEGNIKTGFTRNYEPPLVEEPTSPEPEPLTEEEVTERDIEDAFYEDPDEIPVIRLDVQEFTSNLQSFMQQQMELGEADMSKALVALSPEFASIPLPRLKQVNRLRTEHQVYELPDSHPLIKEMDRREPDDPSPYLLAIWTPGETADSVQPPESTCSSREGGGGLGLCNKDTCFSCNSTREAQAQTVRGTILVPCRTAMRGSFPLNGTYFQVNEVFADHESSLNPIDVPRRLLWNLTRRTVFFGSSVSSIFKGLTTEGIQYCFWKGFVCVRGFEQKTRYPRPLRARLHLPASRISKQNE